MACNGQAPIEEELPQGEGSSQLTELDGKALYQQNCLECHGSLVGSPKTDATPSEINNAINNIVRMGKLDFLSYAQISEISKVLSSSDASRIYPQITSAAPNGKYPGATSTLKIQVSTDLPAACYYSSLDIGIDQMTDQLIANGAKLAHEKEIVLSPGASYKFYVHCKEFTYGNVTKVSQLITFSTDLDAVDSTPPVLSSFFPSAPLLGGTSKAKIYFNSNENATCRYSTSSIATYDQMNLMDTTGTLGHVHVLNNLVSGNSYNYYVLCSDPTGNISNKGTINFSVLSTVDGPTLYANNCMSCHGSLNNSSKRNSTSLEIQNAIINYNAMRIENLQFLSQEQIDAISDAL